MDIVTQTSRRMMWCMAVLVPATWLTFGWRHAVGVGAGMVWSLANAWALTRLVRGSLASPQLPRWRQTAWWVVKLPLLYGVAALMLVSPWSSAVGFLTGFSSWFVFRVTGALRETAV